MIKIDKLKHFIINIIFNIENDERFKNIFNLLNKYRLHGNFRITKITDGVISVKDNDGLEMSLSRRYRLFRYMKGVEYVFNRLADEYLLNKIDFSKGDVVVDCGANIGEVGVYLSVKYGCYVFSLEPDTVEFECLKKNFSRLQLKKGGSQINAGLYNENGDLVFYKKNDTGDSSLIKMDGFVEKETIQVIKFSKLCTDYNIKKVKLLKLEAEGAEPEVLDGISDFSLIHYISADLGPERGVEEELTVVPVIKKLYKNNFELIDMSYPRMCFLFRNKTFTNE